ncbi:hypothetical protein [Pseudoxanthomonas dokdonensis]|uniref:hypothetical protein n=1 Tax=Pseudoxanthomonas dokdonensis TaxID=344882 RepID=UPI0012EEA07D|nr:hypothetical protein [Pseudoxanthomonas dokdonensis]
MKQFILQLAAIGERLDERSAAAVQAVETSAQRMGSEARRLASSSDGFSHEVAQALQLRSAEIIGQGLGQALAQISQQLDAAGGVASRAAAGLEQERQALRAERRTWLWLGCGALLIGSVLAVATSVYVVKQSYQQLSQNRIEAELLRAYNAADVTLCDGRLCANVDSKAKRFGQNEQYLLVQPRRASQQ